MSNNPNQFGNGGGAAETGWESVADMAESAPKIIVEDHFGGEAKRVKTYDENLNEIKAEEFNEQEDRLNYYREHPEKFGQILGKNAGDIQERTEWYLAKPEAERDEILQHEVQAYYEKKAAEKDKGADGVPEVAEEVGRAAVEAAESSPVYQIPKGEGLEVWNDPAYRKQMHEYSKEMQEKRNELIDMDKARQLQEEEAARQRAVYEQQTAEEQRMSEQWQAALAERKGLEDVVKSGERRGLGAEDVEQINETIEDWEKSGAEGLKKLKQEAEKYLAEMAAADLSRYSNEDLKGIARYIEQSRRIIEIVNGKLAGEGAPEGDDPAGEGGASGEEAEDGGVSVPVEEEGGVSVRVTPGETISGGAEDGDGAESELGEESEAESGEAEEKGAEKDERAEESRAEKKDEPRKKNELAKEEMLERGRNLLPEYSHSDWEKVCRSFELNEVRGVYDILEQFMDGSRERALDIVMNEWLDSGRVMGAVVILAPEGADLIREALGRGYADEGGPNEKNQKFLKTYTEMHERNKEAWGKHSERARSEAGDEGAAEGAMTEDVAEKDEAKAGEKMTTLRSAGLEDVEWNERGTEAAKKMNDLAREVLTRIRKEQAYMLYQAEKHGAKGAVDGLSIPEDRVLRALSGRPEEDTEEAWDAYEANALAVINDVHRNLNNLVKHNREMNAAAGGYMDEYEAWMSAAKHKMAEEEKAKRKEMERVADEEYEARREENRRKIAEVNGGEHEFHAEWESMEPSEEYFIAAEDVERTNSKAFEEANKILAYEEKKIMEMPDGRKKKRALENLRLAVDVMNMPMNGIEIPNSILKDLVRNRKYEYAAQLLNRFSGTVPEAQAAVTKWYQDHGYRKAA